MCFFVDTQHRNSSLTSNANLTSLNLPPQVTLDNVTLTDNPRLTSITFNGGARRKRAAPGAYTIASINVGQSPRLVTFALPVDLVNLGSLKLGNVVSLPSVVLPLNLVSIKSM